MGIYLGPLEPLSHDQMDAMRYAFMAMDMANEKDEVVYSRIAIEGAGIVTVNGHGPIVQGASTEVACRYCGSPVKTDRVCCTQCGAPRKVKE